MNRITQFLLLVTLLANASTWGATTNEAVAENYKPFLDGHPWPRFPVVAYVETSSNVWVHPSSPKGFPMVTEVHDPSADFTTVAVKCPDGRIFKTYNELDLGPCLAAVYSGDFNNDGKPDFVAVKEGTGCGLAAAYDTVVFAFSDGNDGYRFTRVCTMDFGLHDIVIDPKTKAFRLIQTSFRQGECVDENIHSFLVHRFYKWEFEEFQRDEDIQPVWVQILNRPNHEPTKLLTPQLKTKVWAEDYESEARIDW
jgi:hypothetical protein